MSEYLTIPAGYYNIGIEETELSSVDMAFVPQGIKKQYIQASSPAHRVFISEFSISKRLVTVNEFSLFARNAQYVTESEKEGWGWVWENGWKKKGGVSWMNPFMDANDDEYRSGDYPVMQVSWNDAVKYTEWISRVENAVYTLPYEREWEVFARKAGIKSLKDASCGNTSKVVSAFQFLERIRQCEIGRAHV